MDPVALLAAYYSRSYDLNLGMKVNRSWMLDCLSEVLQAMRESRLPRLDEEITNDIAIRVRASRHVLAHEERLKPIWRLVHDGVRVLDFGCGDGSSLLLLGRRLREALLVGVDLESPRSLTLEDADVSLRFAHTIAEASEIERSYDLAMAIFSLHHLPEPEVFPTVLSLIGAVRSEGFVYILEDSIEVRNVETDLDGAYDSLDIAQRFEVLRLNDYWANVCCLPTVPVSSVLRL